MKLLILILLTILPVNAGNVYTPKRAINFDTVEVYLSKDLATIQDIEDLKLFARRFNKLPTGIPRIEFIQSEETLEPGLSNSISKSIELSSLSQEKYKMQVFIAYKTDETYGLGNVIGKVFASNSGLILLNDRRIAQAYDYHEGFVINLIIHEIMHVYGLDHAIGLSKYVKDIPVMSLGKSAPVGISFDDMVALFENYDIKNKMASISFASEAFISFPLSSNSLALPSPLWEPLGVEALAPDTGIFGGLRSRAGE
jgi:hypothetical protein